MSTARRASPAPSKPPAPAAPDFRAIYAAEFDYVWSSLRRLGVEGRDLDDLAHDIFVTVYRSLGTYDPSRPLRPWLFGVAFRVVSDFRRKAQHRREIAEEVHEVEDERQSLEGRVEAREARELVLEALSCLELDRKAVFVMHDLNGETVPEIAGALGIPLNTAYSRLRLARQDFAAAVRRLRARRGDE